MHKSVLLLNFVILCNLYNRYRLNDTLEQDIALPKVVAVLLLYASAGVPLNLLVGISSRSRATLL